MPRTLIYSMSTSLDGFIAAPGGVIDWSPPDEELHRFHNERVRRLGAHLLGRRLYETMRFWDGREDDPDLPEVQREFALIWKEIPRLVFSTTLESVEGNARLAGADPAGVAAELKAQGDGEIAVGGAGLAATLAAHDLIDEYQLFVHPVVLGAGTPFFPPLDRRLELELLETRTFGGRVVYLRYSRVRP